VETTDSSACKKYRQVFKNNMSITEKPMRIAEFSESSKF
jgi:hypothetical protein